MANYTGNSPFTIPRPILFKNGVNAGRTITGTGVTLTQKDSWIQIMSNATGVTQDLTLQSPKNGLTYWIVNGSSSTGNVSVKIASGTALANLAANESVFVASDGSDWYAIANG